ncbi:site-specific integrase [Lacibacter sediminis]|uniref:Site-specific integrase n=1 Tax=Lacibacter sediminis TaxID=2760713 RepID=A0A7G5XKX2_9BACT|nr:site-specific integrase [Lacibacter sediminis]QNA46125.1 site-specific integrase [Lacibacter sediminis]
MNTSVKVVLYTSKKLSNGEHPVMLRVTKDRKSKYLSTGFKCSPDLWDAKTNLPKKKHPLYIQAKVLIAKKTVQAEKLILDLEADDKSLSVHEIKGKLRKEKVNNPLLFLYFDKVIERFKQSGQIKNGEIYKDTKRNLSQFVNAKQLHFSDIDIEFLNKFEEYLKSNNKGANTIYIYLRTLRALLNKAIKEEVSSDKYYPFKKFSLAKYANIKTEKRAITKDEIKKIADLDITKHPHLIDAKNIFMFSYYCRGINFIDLVLLKWKDVKSGRLLYTRKKTKELFNIEILKPVTEILDYYKPFTFRNNESYIFPILNENYNTPTMLYNRKEKMIRKINKDLKEIAAKCEIESELTTYVARHSYATILKKSGISTSVISEAMGHDSEKTTKIYLESFENNILDEASKVLL